MRVSGSPAKAFSMRSATPLENVSVAVEQAAAEQLGRWGGTLEPRRRY